MQSTPLTSQQTQPISPFDERELAFIREQTTAINNVFTAANPRIGERSYTNFLRIIVPTLFYVLDDYEREYQRLVVNEITFFVIHRIFLQEESWRSQTRAILFPTIRTQITIPNLDPLFRRLIGITILPPDYQSIAPRVITALNQPPISLSEGDQTLLLNRIHALEAADLAAEVIPGIPPRPQLPVNFNARDLDETASNGTAITSLSAAYANAGFFGMISDLLSDADALSRYGAESEMPSVVGDVMKGFGSESDSIFGWSDDGDDYNLDDFLDDDDEGGSASGSGSTTPLTVSGHSTPSQKKSAPPVLPQAGRGAPQPPAAASSSGIYVPQAGRGAPLPAPSAPPVSKQMPPALAAPAFVPAGRGTPSPQAGRGAPLPAPSAPPALAAPAFVPAGRGTPAPQAGRGGAPLPPQAAPITSALPSAGRGAPPSPAGRGTTSLTLNAPAFVPQSKLSTDAAPFVPGRGRGTPSTSGGRGQQQPTPQQGRGMPMHPNARGMV